MNVRKTVLTVTVLHDETMPLRYVSLETLAGYIDTGDMIGNVEIASEIAVPHDQVRAELLALGNDGDFFGEFEDELDQVGAVW